MEYILRLQKDLLKIQEKQELSVEGSRLSNLTNT